MVHAMKYVRLNVDRKLQRASFLITLMRTQSFVLTVCSSFSVLIPRSHATECVDSVAPHQCSLPCSPKCVDITSARFRADPFSFYESLRRDVSANRDERQFNEPDALNFLRQPNRHVAFGRGIHFCLGASLARLEGQVAVRTLLDRTEAYVSRFRVMRLVGERVWCYEA